MFENLFTTKTATKKKVDFSNLFANKVEAPKTKVFKLNESLGGGSFNVGNAGELVKTDRGYAGIDAPGEYREHIFPVSLGGTSETDNIKVYGKDLGEKKSKYENDIIRQYKAGKVSLNEARGLVLKKFRELTGLDPKQGTANYLWEGFKSTLAIPFKRSAEKTREKQKEAIESVDIKDKRSQLFSYFGKQRTMINPAVSIMPIKMPKEYTQDDIAKMGAEEIKKLYSQIYKTEASASQETTMELVSAVLPTAAKLPGEIVKLGNINKIKQGIRETPEVIDLRGTEMIEPKKVGRITEQGFEPVKVEPTVAKTIESPKKELNLDAFKKSVKKQEPIVQEIQKAKAEGKSFDEWVVSEMNKKPKYGMSHRPTFEDAPPAYNLLESDMLPRDVYTKPEWSIASGRSFKTDKSAQESWEAIQKIKGKPDAEITVYRASPKNELNSGDWVTFSKNYAEGEGAYEGSKVFAHKVKAKDIFFAGDDINEFGYFPKSQLKQLWDTAEIKAPKVEKPIIAPEPKKSITAQKLNEIMPDEYKLNENYDAITLKGELDRASKEISTNSEEALRKAFDKNERVDRRIAKLEEFSQIAKRDNDYDAVNRLFTQANKIGTETAQGLNMMKALHSVNPEYKYMQDVVDARLKKVKVGVGDIKKAKEGAKKAVMNKASDLKYKTKTAIKVKDAQKLLDKLMC